MINVESDEASEYKKNKKIKKTLYLSDINVRGNSVCAGTSYKRVRSKRVIRIFVNMYDKSRYDRLEQ